MALQFRIPAGAHSVMLSVQYQSVSHTYQDEQRDLLLVVDLDTAVLQLYEFVPEKHPAAS